MKRSERGSVFILTLGIMVGLIAIVASIAATQRLTMRAQSNREETVRAKIAADAAIQRALAVISTNDSTAPSLTTDDWATLGTNGDDRFILGALTFRLQILDACSRLGLNTVNEATLQKLPLTTEQIDSLLDWRETGQSARSEGGKDSYYNNLPEPYNTKLRRFDSVDELLSVKGFTAADVYFYNPNVSASGNSLTTTTGTPLPLSLLMAVNNYSDQNATSNQQKLNINTANQQTLSQRLQGFGPADIQNLINGRPYTRIGDVCARSGGDVNRWKTILDNLTVSSAARVEGKINLNTTTDQVLNALPGMTTDLTNSVITHQSTGFTNLSNLLDLSGFNNISTLQQTADYFTTRSQSFIVRALGKAGSTTYAEEALIVIENQTPRIERVNPCPLDDPITYWNWNTDTTSDITLKEEQ